MPLIQPQWVEGSKFSAGDAIVSEPVDALRENVERTYQTRYRTLWGSCPILTATLDEARATVRTSVSSSGGVRVTAYATGAASADVTIETLDGVDSETVTLTWAAVGVQMADISEAWITSDTRYRVTVERVSGTIAAVEVCELDGEAEEMAGISTVWADVSTFANLPTLNLRVGDLCITTDTGYRWEVQSLGPTVWEIVEVGEVASIAALPSSDVREGATATIKGDAWTYKSGSWSSQPITISSWASRPRGSSSYDGRWGVCNSRVYRYSQTGDANDLGDWVPPEVYAGSVTFRARIVGDVVPSSESPAWTHNTSGAGTITQTGSVVRLSATTGGAGQLANVTISHGVSGGKYYMAGFVTAASLGETLGVSIGVGNGTVYPTASTGNTTGNGWQASNFFGMLDPKFATVTSGLERWVELLVANGVAQVWADQTLVAVQLTSAFSPLAATTFNVGDYGHFWRGILDVRQLRCVTF